MPTTVARETVGRPNRASQRSEVFPDRVIADPRRHLTTIAGLGPSVIRCSRHGDRDLMQIARGALAASASCATGIVI
jgi:hypothetical protein